MLTVKKTSVMREEMVLVAQPYGEHRESMGSCQGGAGLQEEIFRGEGRAAAYDNNSPSWS